MRYLILIMVLLFPHLGFSQDAKIRVLNEEKINDSLLSQTLELIIHNDTQDPICLKLSTSFLTILATDTVELAPISYNEGCIHYALWVSKKDYTTGVNDLPRFPVVLNSRTSFVANVRVVKNVKCRSAWIEFSFTNQDSINYQGLLEKYSKNEVWDDKIIRFKIERVNIPD